MVLVGSPVVAVPIIPPAPLPVVVEPVVPMLPGPPPTPVEVIPPKGMPVVDVMPPSVVMPALVLMLLDALELAVTVVPGLVVEVTLELAAVVMVLAVVEAAVVLAVPVMVPPLAAVVSVGLSLPHAAKQEPSAIALSGAASLDLGLGDFFGD